MVTYFLPIRRLTSKTVFSGLMVAWFLAASPIKRSFSVKATHEGVTLFPWSLAMISTFPFLKIPTQLYVVPKSIPITLVITFSFSSSANETAKSNTTMNKRLFNNIVEVGCRTFSLRQRGSLAGSLFTKTPVTCSIFVVSRGVDQSLSPIPRRPICTTFYNTSSQN